MNSSLNLSNDSVGQSNCPSCHQMSIAQIQRNNFWGIFWGVDFLGTPNNFKIEVNFLISSFPLFYLVLNICRPVRIQIVSACRSFGAIACSSRSSWSFVRFLNINLRFLNDCQVLSTQMFSSVTTYLKRNFKRRPNFAPKVTKAFVLLCVWKVSLIQMHKCFWGSVIMEPFVSIICFVINDVINELLVQVSICEIRKRHQYNRNHKEISEPLSLGRVNNFLASPNQGIFSALIIIDPSINFR